MELNDLESFLSPMLDFEIGKRFESELLRSTGMNVHAPFRDGNCFFLLQLSGDISSNSMTTRSPWLCNHVLEVSLKIFKSHSRAITIADSRFHANLWVSRYMN